MGTCWHGRGSPAAEQHRCWHRGPVRILDDQEIGELVRRKLGGTPVEILASEYGISARTFWRYFVAFKRAAPWAVHVASVVRRWRDLYALEVSEQEAWALVDGIARALTEHTSLPAPPPLVERPGPVVEGPAVIVPFVDALDEDWRSQRPPRPVQEPVPAAGTFLRPMHSRKGSPSTLSLVHGDLSQW